MDKSDRKNAVGIAFSGGGLQGIAHIGAVKALHELGIFPDFVSGTSSGSAMAALVAMGCNYKEMNDFAERYWEVLADFRPIPIVTQLAALKFNKRTEKDGLKDGEVISNVIREAMDSKNINGFDDLPINLSICSNDTHTMDECIFTTEKEDIHREHIHYIHGAPLELAVRASMTFPGIYTTCDYEGYNFIDGGSKDNLPVQILKDMGVGRILAIAFDISDYTPGALDLYSIDKTRRSMKEADYCVQIKNSNTAIFSMENFETTIREGYDCVMKHKDDLVKLFGKQ